MSGYLSTSIIDDYIEKIKKMVMDNHLIIIRKLIYDFESCNVIDSDVLGMKNVEEKFVPKLMNFEQKQN